MLHWRQVGFLMETHKKLASEKTRGKWRFDRCRSVACFLRGLNFAGYAEDFVSLKEGGDPDGSKLELPLLQPVMARSSPSTSHVRRLVT